MNLHDTPSLVLQPPPYNYCTVLTYSYIFLVSMTFLTDVVFPFPPVSCKISAFLYYMQWNVSARQGWKN